MEKEEEVDTKRGGKTISKSRQGTDFASSIRGSLGEDKIERDCFEVICGAPTTLQSYGID